MTTIGILSEGVTDQKVITQVLLGFFADQADDLEINPEFPPTVVRGGGPEVGGWTVLKKLLESKHHLQALQYNDYIVVHIDSDCCEEIGFDVSRRDRQTGKDLRPDALRGAVIERLVDWLGEISKDDRERVLFAVAVDSIECWLLPMLESKPAKQAKTVHCSGAADRALEREGRPPLRTGRNRVRRYEEEAAPYRDRAVLMSTGRISPSLDAFVAELEARGIVIDPLPGG